MAPSQPNRENSTGKGNSPDADANPVLTVTNLSVENIFRNVSLSLMPGEILFVTGPSG